MVDKSLMWVSIIVALAVGFLIGFVAMRQRAIGTMEAFKLVTQRQIEETKQSASKQNEQLRLGRVYVLENGKLMLEEVNKAAVGETVTLSNGTTLSITGFVTKPNGSTVQLNEGEIVSDNGTIIMRDSVKGSDTKQ